MWQILKRSLPLHPQRQIKMHHSWSARWNRTCWFGRQKRHLEFRKAWDIFGQTKQTQSGTMQAGGQSEHFSLKNSCGSCQNRNRTKRRQQRQKNYIPCSLMVLEMTLAIVSVKWSEAKLGMITVRGFCNTDREVKVTQETSGWGETWSNEAELGGFSLALSTAWHIPSKPGKFGWQQRMIFHDNQGKE